MINSNLILFEGIPGSGKSTTARSVSIQLDLAGVPNSFIHELASNHPINFFNEVYLNETEFSEFSELLSLFDSVSGVTTTIENMYCVSLLELRRSHLISNKAELIKELFPFFWINDPSRYLAIARTKVQSFVKRVIEENEVIIMEGSIIQFFTDGLLLNGFSKSVIMKFINSLMEELKSLNPVIIYLTPSDKESSIRKMFEIRGETYKVGRHFPYAQGKQKNDFELYIDFLTEYDEIAQEIVNHSNFVKLSIDIAKRNWIDYEQLILRILEVGRCDKMLDNHHFSIFTGEYVWNDLTFKISFENGILYGSYNNYKKRLIPKNESEFYICDNSVELLFSMSSDKKTSSNCFTIGGRDISQDWSVIGNKFTRLLTEEHDPTGNFS
ncbi:hypothetical protein H8B09_13015 [Paenibacillus sp. PR3]|uniref:Uncharacterized protein n=1 Tax=Paenibacillus terricola TaxID=2763503 RepID=A0ABR8MUN9_9BACL|nr:hypothetical protein [Paenibacillus terricola]MBD3919678.1 hypothetical protein [Paenibacillus terricola]